MSDLARRDLGNVIRLYHLSHVKIALTGIDPLSFHGAMAFTVRKKGHGRLEVSAASELCG